MTTIMDLFPSLLSICRLTTGRGRNHFIILIDSIGKRRVKLSPIEPPDVLPPEELPPEVPPPDVLPPEELPPDELPLRYFLLDVPPPVVDELSKSTYCSIQFKYASTRAAAPTPPLVSQYG